MRHDPLSPSERTELMSRIRSGDTKPEMAVRRLVYSMGYRYRLRVKDLPGRPDLVFKGRKKVIFVHGCFWHQHGCDHYRMPRSRTDFWLTKLAKNVARDEKVMRELSGMGWRVLVIWECQLRDMRRVERAVRGFLEAE